MFAIPDNYSNQLSDVEIIKQLTNKQSFNLVEYEYTKSDAYSALFTEMPVLIFVGIFGYFLLACIPSLLGNQTLANQLITYLPPYLIIAIICAIKYTHHLFHKVAKHTIVLDIPNKTLLHNVEKDSETKSISATFNELILACVIDSGEYSSPDKILRIAYVPKDKQPRNFNNKFSVEIYRDGFSIKNNKIKKVVEAFVANTGIKYVDFSG
jgi:hypothetical protein